MNLLSSSAEGACVIAPVLRWVMSCSLALLHDGVCSCVRIPSALHHFQTQPSFTASFWIWAPAASKALPPSRSRDPPRLGSSPERPLTSDLCVCVFAGGTSDHGRVHPGCHRQQLQHRSGTRWAGFSRPPSGLSVLLPPWSHPRQRPAAGSVSGRTEPDGGGHASTEEKLRLSAPCCSFPVFICLFSSPLSALSQDYISMTNHKTYTCS